MTNDERNPKSEILKVARMVSSSSFVIRHSSFLLSTSHEHGPKTAPEFACGRGLRSAPGFLELEKSGAAHLRFSACRPCVPRSLFHPGRHHDGRADQVRLAETPGECSTTKR